MYFDTHIYAYSAYKKFYMFISVMNQVLVKKINALFIKIQ